MDNLAWPFNFLIYKDCVGTSYQTVPQMMYILRWAATRERGTESATTVRFLTDSLEIL